MFYFMYITIPLICGAVLDMIFGEPKHMKHPVVIIGSLISFLEKKFNAAPESGANGQNQGDDHARYIKKKKRRGGVITAALVCVSVILVSVIIPAAAFAVGFSAGSYMSHAGIIPWLIGGMLAELFCGRLLCLAAMSVMCWLMLAAKSLRQESMKVYEALERGDVEGARYSVSMIVGRDTSVLDRNGIIKAAVETVAENTSDGVTAPVFWMAIFGIPGLYFYKAVNTMDSMIGYKNDRYMDFGRCAARLDDVLNYIPSRLTALLMIAAAWIMPGYDGRGAWRTWRRDRRKHASPNSAQTESACAGALGLELAGPAVYFGVIHEKPFIGDPERNIEPDDIPAANRLMLATAFLMIVFLMILFLTAAAAAAGVFSGGIIL